MQGTFIITAVGGYNYQYSIAKFPVKGDFFMTNLKSLALCMLLTAALFVAAPAATFAAQAQPVRDTISVTGSASSENEPDMATVSLSMTERGKTAAEARRALASRIDKFNASRLLCA